MAQETTPFLPEFDGDDLSRERAANAELDRRFEEDRILARLFLRSSITPREALDEEYGLTLSQIKVLDEELLYQDQSLIGRNLVALTHQVSVFGSVVAGIMGGNSQGISESIKLMMETAEEYQMVTSDSPTKRQQEEEQTRELVETNPMFQKFRQNASFILGRQI